MNFESLHAYFLRKRGCMESFPFDEHTLVFKVGDKMFGLMSLRENPPRINLKCNPEKAIELRMAHDWVLPGYHMNKKHWNTVVVKDMIDEAILKQFIDHSYELVFNALTAKVKERVLKG